MPLLTHLAKMEWNVLDHSSKQALASFALQLQQLADTHPSAPTTHDTTDAVDTFEGLSLSLFLSLSLALYLAVAPPLPPSLSRFLAFALALSF